jgi:hypothetical protein
MSSDNQDAARDQEMLRSWCTFVTEIDKDFLKHGSLRMACRCHFEFVRFRIPLRA